MKKVFNMFMIGYNFIKNLKGHYMINNKEKHLIINGNNLKNYKIAVENNEISVHTVTGRGTNALFYANADKALYLLEKGIDVNKMDNQNNTALVKYIDERTNIYYCPEKEKIINAFFENGLDIKLYQKNVKRLIKDADFNEDLTMLEEKFDLINYLSTKNLKKLYAENPSLFKRHIAKKDYMQTSPLFYADRQGQEFLISIGLDVNAKNMSGENALFFVKSTSQIENLVNKKIKIKVGKENVNQFNESFFYALCRNNFENLSADSTEHLNFKITQTARLINIIEYFKKNYPDINLLDFGYSTPEIGKSPYGLQILIEQDYLNYAKEKFPENYSKNFEKIIIAKVNDKDFQEILKDTPVLSFKKSLKYIELLLTNNPYNFIKILPYIKDLPIDNEAFSLFHKFTCSYYNNTCRIKINPKDLGLVFNYLKMDKSELDKSGIKETLLSSIIENTLSDGEILKIIAKELDVNIKKELKESHSSTYLLTKTTKKNIDYFYDSEVEYFKNSDLIEIIRENPELDFIIKFLLNKEKEVLEKNIQNVTPPEIIKKRL